MLRYLKSIGLNSNQPRGRGFNHPYDIAISSDERIYVLNRMYPNSALGIRVQICDMNDEWYGEFGESGGDGANQFLVPVAMDFDRNDRLYVTDESHHQVKIFDKNGSFIEAWGRGNSKASNLSGPSGICVDSQGEIIVVEQYPGKITKISSDGEIQFSFGENGTNNGQFDLPWGVTVDREDNIYVADWRNDRVQKFTMNGEFIMSVGVSGEAPGELKRPSGVAVDRQGVIYVADWGNERVQIFDAEGKFIRVLQGNADLSKWSVEWLESNLDQYRAREESTLMMNDLPEHLRTPYHIASQTEPIFWGPVSVVIDSNDRLLVTEHSRHRIQIFELEKSGVT